MPVEQIYTCRLIAVTHTQMLCSDKEHNICFLVPPSEENADYWNHTGAPYNRKLDQALVQKFYSHVTCLYNNFPSGIGRWFSMGGASTTWHSSLFPSTCFRDQKLPIVAHTMNGTYAHQTTQFVLGDLGPYGPLYSYTPKTRQNGGTYLTSMQHQITLHAFLPQLKACLALLLHVSALAVIDSHAFCLVISLFCPNW